jgi:hypothetical protein
MARAIAELGTDDPALRTGAYPQRFIRFLNRKPEPTAFLVSPTLPLAITDQVDNGFGRRIDLDSLISIPSRYGAPFVPFMVGDPGNRSATRKVWIAEG